MSEKESAEITETYRIKVKGILDEKWSDWFDDFRITHCQKKETILVGSIPDQGALHGLLAKIRDLGLPILSVECLTQESKNEEI